MTSPIFNLDNAVATLLHYPGSTALQQFTLKTRRLEILIIAVVAFLAAVLTFFSGFGLGTILTPVFMLFFPVDVAIGLTGVVHFFNNVFKLLLVGKKADWNVLVRFGLPAIIAAILGSLLLLRMSDQDVWYTYEWLGRTFEIYPLKLLIACLLIVFAIMDLVPRFQQIQIDKKFLPVGGVLSGFFGGLSGNQGALRSAFLIKAGLTKEAFIGTAVVVSTLVDFTRLSVYAGRFTQSGLTDNWLLVTIATLAGIAGAFIGNKLLKKVTLRFIQVTVAVLLIVISIGLGAGWF